MQMKPDDDRLVLDVPEAGAKLGLGRNASYAAAKRGDIPTIKIGRLLRVPVRALELMLDKASGSQAAASREEKAS
jgi:Helix-turn-helix domain